MARLRGRTETALNAYRAYFEEGGQCAFAYRALGRLLLENDKLAGAEDALLRAAAAEPRLPGVRFALGILAAIRGDGPGAIEQFEAEIRISPDDPAPLLEIALVHERLLGETEKADVWFERFRQEGGDPKLVTARRRGGRSARPEAGRP